MHDNLSGRAIDLGHALQIVRRRGSLVLLCVVVAGGVAFAISKHEQKQYTATASLFFRNAQVDQQASGLAAAPLATTPQAQTDTNLKLASLRSIAAATAAAVGQGQTAGSVSGAVTVAPESDTSLASVTAVAPSPSLAAELANVYASKAIAYRRQADKAYYSYALRAVNLQYKALTPSQRRGVQGSDLQDRISSLQILGQLQGQSVQLAQSANPPGAPSSPRTTRNTTLGVLLGLLLGLALASGAERFDRRLREPGDIEAAYGVPLLGVVPTSSALRAEGKGSTGALALPAGEAEIFGMLRAQVRYLNLDQDRRVLAVVSASAGDGKTTIARNLVLATASTGARVLFVEADLRRPTAAKHFGVRSPSGIADVLTGQKSLEDAVQTIHFTDHSGQSVPVDLLLAGSALPANPVQALESEAMATLLEQAKSSYDLVVVDTPPIAMVSDAFPVVRRADAVLIVSRPGRNRRDVALRLRQTLDRAEATVIGVVANGFRRGGGGSYGYEYSEYVADTPVFTHADGDWPEPAVARSEAASDEEWPAQDDGATPGDLRAKVAPEGVDGVRPRVGDNGPAPATMRSATDVTPRPTHPLPNAAGNGQPPASRTDIPAARRLARRVQAFSSRRRRDP